MKGPNAGVSILGFSGPVDRVRYLVSKRGELLVGCVVPLAALAYSIEDGRLVSGLRNHHGPSSCRRSGETCLADRRNDYGLHISSGRSAAPFGELVSAKRGAAVLGCEGHLAALRRFGYAG